MRNGVKKEKTKEMRKMKRKNKEERKKNNLTYYKLL